MRISATPWHFPLLGHVRCLYWTPDPHVREQGDQGLHVDHMLGSLVSSGVVGGGHAPSSQSTMTEEAPGHWSGEPPHSRMYSRFPGPHVTLQGPGCHRPQLAVDPGHSASLHLTVRFRTLVHLPRMQNRTSSRLPPPHVALQVPYFHGLYSGAIGQSWVLHKVVRVLSLWLSPQSPVTHERVSVWTPAPHDALHSPIAIHGPHTGHSLVLHWSVRTADPGHVLPP